LQFVNPHPCPPAVTQEGDEVLFYSCNNLKTKAKVDAGVYGRCTVVRAVSDSAQL
jgi:hypothetical protein